jgi:hypothetical protein
LDATAVCNEAAVDVPMQFPAKAPAPVAVKAAEDPDVQELQKDSRLSRLAVNCLLKAFTQLFPPQFGLYSLISCLSLSTGGESYGAVGFGGGEEVQAELVAAALLSTGRGRYAGFSIGVVLLSLGLNPR